MSTIEQSIEVEVPVQTAYNQWTQFEEFPQFMEGVEQIRQIDDTHLHWVAEFGGSRHDGTPRSPSSCRTSASHGATPTARRTRASSRSTSSTTSARA
jgi:hypothetical protein